MPEDAGAYRMYRLRASEQLRSPDPLGILSYVAYNGATEHLTAEDAAAWQRLEDAIMAELVRRGEPIRFGHLQVSRERAGRWLLTYDDLGLRPAARAPGRGRRRSDHRARSRARQRAHGRARAPLAGDACAA